MGRMDKEEFNRIVDEKLPDSGPITEEDRLLTKKEGTRFRGALRLSLGMFWTDGEYNEYRDKVLATPLP
jgi:hypothetical protein